MGLAELVPPVTENALFADDIDEFPLYQAPSLGDFVAFDYSRVAASGRKDRASATNAKTKSCANAETLDVMRCGSLAGFVSHLFKESLFCWVFSVFTRVLNCFDTFIIVDVVFDCSYSFVD